jgi:hypothetical protein
MVSGYSRWFRLILILILAGIFMLTAYLIFRKQQEKYSYTSFRVPNETAGVMIPNIDRLREKITSASDLQLQELPQILNSAINGVIGNKSFKFSEKLSPGCFISYNTTEFLIAFQTSGLTTAELSGFLKDDFIVNSVFAEGTLTIEDITYSVAQFNHFLVISNCDFEANIISDKEHFGNADYIVYRDSSTSGDHHIIKDFSHHIVSSENQIGPQGKPLLHEAFISFVPSVFSELYFFGSTRFNSDQHYFFNQPEPKTFDWIDGGLIILRKDSFELMIAPQNSELDLKLTLEEETLLKRGDTSFIPYFNIGPYKVMPFETNLNWQKTIPGQKDNFHFFTELDNFNILANSIPAMRWYLGELQLGNLLTKNEQLFQLYCESLPQRAHMFSIESGTGKTYQLVNKIWIDSSECIVSKSISGGSAKANEPAKLYASFEINFTPISILTLKKNETELILLTGSNQIDLYDTSGNKMWSVSITNQINGKPQIIDLENDGVNEIVLFQTNQMNILDINGNALNGFPKKFNAPSSGGIAVNYDNSFNYRFLTNIGNEIKSLDETGNPVIGWMFSQMTTTLQGDISYYVTQGKDMISFKDNNNKQYVINRRGESRLTKITMVNLPNESPFVVGNYDESSLRKLGYKNNFIYNYYLLDGQKDSVKLDRNVNPLQAYWIFNNNQPLLVIEESERVVVIDEFGYEKESVLKPVPNQAFGGLVIGDSFKYVFVDNSENALYLLDGFGKMIFPIPVRGSNVFHLNDRLLYTAAGNRINIYQIEE